MTANYTTIRPIRRRRGAKLSYRADFARAAANFTAFLGGLLILLTAGASDTHVTALSDLCVRLALGALLIGFSFVIRGYARELDHRAKSQTEK